MTEAQNPTRLTFVGCEKEKKSRTDEDGYPVQWPAADLYSSNSFALKRDYAERMSESWYVLSAKHGRVGAFNYISPYDVSLSTSGFDGDGDPIYETVDDWSSSVIRSTDSDLKYHKYNHHVEGIEEVVVLARKAYVEPIRESLISICNDFDVTVRFPFDKTSDVDEQMVWLKENTDQSRQLSEQYLNNVAEQN